MSPRAAGALLGLALVAAGRAGADGGVVCARGGDGPLRLSLFVAPTPLRVGRAELSVWLERGSEAGPPPPIRLRVSRPDFCEPTRDLEAVPGGAGGALPGATVALEIPGPVVIEAHAVSGVRRVAASCRLEVAPASSPLAAHWPALALPPTAVALYAAHRALAAREAGRRRHVVNRAPRRS